MEKITFASADSQENEEFFVLEQTKLNGVSYILVTDSEEDDAECWILKDTSPEESSEAIYEFVEDEKELNGIMGVFEELLEDVPWVEWVDLVIVFYIRMPEDILPEATAVITKKNMAFWNTSVVELYQLSVGNLRKETISLINPRLYPLHTHNINMAKTTIPSHVTFICCSLFKFYHIDTVVQHKHVFVPANLKEVINSTVNRSIIAL